MMGHSATRRLSVDEYLIAEERSETKNEFYDAQTFAVAGASEPHELVANEIRRLLGNQFADAGSACDALGSDTRILTRGGLYTYPDVLVVCDDRQFSDESRMTLTNPFVLIEVLSPSTILYDLNTKSRLYRAIPSLTDYIAVWQDEMRARHHRQLDQPLREGGDNWIAEEFDEPDDILFLPAVDARLRLGDFYRRVTLPEPDTQLRKPEQRPENTANLL